VRWRVTALRATGHRHQGSTEIEASGALRAVDAKRKKKIGHRASAACGDRLHRGIRSMKIKGTEIEVRNCPPNG
jgi:hypothetical protein